MLALLLTALAAVVTPEGMETVPAVPGLSEAEVRAALRGELVVHTETFSRPGGKAAGRGVGAVVIARPAAAVWAVLSRFEDKAEYMPRIKQVDVLAQEPGRRRVRMVVDASVTTSRYTAWFALDEAGGTIRWKLDRTAPDNTIADTEGEWRLYPLGPARTLLYYRTYVDTGRAIPRFIQDYMTRRSLPNLLKAVRARVEARSLPGGARPAP